MKLLELKMCVDQMVDNGCGEYPVLISLSEQSICTRASTGIKYIYTGFDWESGQVRIEPLDPICKVGKSKNDCMKINIHSYSSARQYYSCPRCEQKIKKDSNYCSNCGQHLYFDPNNKPVDGWKKDY